MTEMMQEEPRPAIDLPETLETERLTLRPLTMDDAENMFETLTPEICYQILQEEYPTVEAAAEHLRKKELEMKQGKRLDMAILSKEGEFLGEAALRNMHDTISPLEISIWLKDQAQGMGYGLEASQALLDWARENLEFVYLLYRAETTNEGSNKIAQALGGVLYSQQRFTKGDRTLDMNLYKIDK